MKKLIKKYIFRKEYTSLYDGIGYMQGIGFSMNLRVIYIFGIRFIQNIEFRVEKEWTRSLIKKIKANKNQEELIDKMKEKDLNNS